MNPAHQDCTLARPCTLTGCPAELAARRRREAEAARWDALTRVYGLYYLSERPLRTGDTIELQPSAAKTDDFGLYTTPLDGSVLVTFGFHYGRPVISKTFGNTQFCAEVHDGMGFRWPAPQAITPPLPAELVSPAAVRCQIAAAIRDRYGAADPGSAAAEAGARIIWTEIADLIERGQL